MPAQQFAVPVAGDRFIGEMVFGEEGQHVADEQQSARIPSRCDHAVGVGGNKRDRLLAEDVLSGLQGADRRRGVPRGRKTNVDHVQARIGEHCVQAVIAVDPAQVHHLTRRAEVPLDRPPVACKTDRVLLAEAQTLTPLTR